MQEMNSPWFDVQSIEKYSVEEIYALFSKKLGIIKTLDDNRRDQQAHYIQMREVAVQVITWKNRVASQLTDAMESGLETAPLESRSKDLDDKYERIKAVLTEAEHHLRHVGVENEISSYPASVQARASSLIRERNQKLQEAMIFDLHENYASSGINELATQYREALRSKNKSKIKELKSLISKTSDELSHSIFIQRQAQVERAKEINTKYEELLGELK